jgi:hypothetical protein
MRHGTLIDPGGSGRVRVERISVVNFGGQYISVEKAQADARALRTLLADARVKVAIEADQC